MSTSTQRGLAATAAAALLWLPTLAMAAPGSASGTDLLNLVSGAGSSITTGSGSGSGTVVGTGSGSGTSTTTTNTTTTNTGAFCISPTPCGATAVTPPGSALEEATPQPSGASFTTTQNAFEFGSTGFVQSDAARRNPLSSFLRGPSDLALWNLTALFKAQRNGAVFESIDTGLTSLSVALAADAPSPVPLPAAAWLFVAGALGLARKRKGKGKGKAKDKHALEASSAVAP